MSAIRSRALSRQREVIMIRNLFKVALVVALTFTTQSVTDVPNGILVETLHVGDDWIPLSFSSNGKVESDAIIFAGYGISSAELKYDDYAVSSVRDRVAIVFAGTPDGDNPHGQ